MTLHLVELLVTETEPTERFASGARVAASASGGRVIEATFASELNRLYLIVEGSQPDALTDALRSAAYRVEGVAPVRLVGETPKRNAPSPSHLVEWDLPINMKMDQYLKRKAEKAPLYAAVPEVRFLRTYVREDMVKCVCLYDAPDEDAVRRAREAVGAPVDRLTRVAPSDEE
ncbi:MAG: DUF4242 domain-containing protein [Polyangiaceae bacterium]|jgi:hypothetical protein